MEASTKALRSIQSISITMQCIKGSNYTCPGGWVDGWVGLQVIIGLISVQLQLKFDFQLELSLAIYN